MKGEAERHNPGKWERADPQQRIAWRLVDTRKQQRQWSGAAAHRYSSTDWSSTGGQVIRWDGGESLEMQKVNPGIKLDPAIF